MEFCPSPYMRNRHCPSIPGLPQERHPSNPTHAKRQKFFSVKLCVHSVFSVTPAFIHQQWSEPHR